MNEFELNLKLITPMFLKADDSSQNGQPVLRAAPFRGVMRYWLRALISENNVPGLKEKEGNVFGDTRAGSVVNVNFINHSQLNTSMHPMLPHRIMSGKNPLNALGFTEGQNIRMRIRGRSGLTFDDKAILSLLFFLNLGGIGKRTRRGFGSLQCTQVDFSSALLAEKIAEKFWNNNPEDGQELISRIESLLQLLPNSNVIIGNNLANLNHYQIAEYPSFKNSCWAIVVGDVGVNAFQDYTALMQDFWCNHLRTAPNMDQFAYGCANPRHASPLHVHIAQSNAGYHIVLTAFFAKPTNQNQKKKIYDLLQECCQAYHGTAFYD